MEYNNKNIEIENSEGIILKSIDENDLDYLRLWKNQNRSSFFFKEMISLEQQKKWYDDYLKRDCDFMLKIVANGKIIGCMGFRIDGEEVDLYNIIRGEKGICPGAMHKAMKMMVNYIGAHYQGKIKCDVLKSNKAIDWYIKCGFFIADDKDDYVVMRIN